jgi:hypothetical protein
MSTIKEPNFFASDFAGCQVIQDAQEYATLFRGGQGKLRGESSTCYLRSEVAIPTMIERRPAIRIIALVRNPLDLFQSYHNEVVRCRHEDLTDPERAWQIQELRALGQRVPSKCPEPRILQYRWMCSLGKQIERLCQLVPAAQRKVIVYDDLLADPIGCIEEIYKFLGIAKQEVPDIPRTNEFAVPRSLLITDFIQALQAKTPFRELRLRAKGPFNRAGIEPLNWLWRMNLRVIPKPPLPYGLRSTLKAEFAGDVAILGRSLNRDFSGWLD